MLTEMQDSASGGMEGQYLIERLPHRVIDVKVKLPGCYPSRKGTFGVYM